MRNKIILISILTVAIAIFGSRFTATSIWIAIISCLVVLGGTFLGTIFSFNRLTIEHLMESLQNLAPYTPNDHEALVEYIVDLARKRRTEGRRALEAEALSIDNPVLKKGIEMIADGYSRYEIQTTLEKQYEIYCATRESELNVLNTLVKLAPIFGFIGTIIGLMSVLRNIGSPEEVGQGMAVALLTTLYGLLYANLFFLPLSKQHAEKTKSEVSFFNIIIEGILDIFESKNAKAIKYRQQTYLKMAGGEEHEEKE